MAEKIYDLAIIGGGVNGCGVARDAAGRGLSVLLCEQGDLAEATSSASTKLFHGGLRYLEFYEFRLVRKALIEREVLLSAMPHISWPLRFVLPHHRGMRPRWLLRLGLFIYDHLGGRKVLPPTRGLDLSRDPVGAPLKPEFRYAFEYSDCWVEDSRLVVLNARDAADRGADIRTRTRCEAARREDGHWSLSLRDVETGAETKVRSKALVNAAGPWVEDVVLNRIGENSTHRIRLVRGSHIVTKRIFDHDKPYIFQQSDGRIVFAIPYETDFTLIGTTDADHEGDPGAAECTADERAYLCRAVSEYFRAPVTEDQIVWTYSGVRPLYDDGVSSATQATRDYVLKLSDHDGRVPLVNVFGGKITTYRRLAKAVLAKLDQYFPGMGPDWTASAPLPGGDFPVDGAEAIADALVGDYPFLDQAFARRLVRAYGTQAPDVLGTARSMADLGRCFGWNLTEREVVWLIEKEWARSAEDVVWRRSKIGLRLTKDQISALEDWIAAKRSSGREIRASG
ncbi:MAG: glycerol-3-phosphate dehydrogenase [Paracoccaceae bacterium]|nr:glycerol-3-phosphate dehydrogenase [Paracoccaceae bacterium]